MVQNSWAKMHVAVPQNLPISVEGFFEDSYSLQAFSFPARAFQFFNANTNRISINYKWRHI